MYFSECLLHSRDCAKKIRYMISHLSSKQPSTWVLYLYELTASLILCWDPLRSGWFQGLCLAESNLFCGPDSKSPSGWVTEGPPAFTASVYFLGIGGHDRHPESSIIPCPLWPQWVLIWPQTFWCLCVHVCVHVSVRVCACISACLWLGESAVTDERGILLFFLKVLLDFYTKVKSSTVAPSEIVSSQFSKGKGNLRRQSKKQAPSIAEHRNTCVWRKHAG